MKTSLSRAFALFACHAILIPTGNAQGIRAVEIANGLDWPVYLCSPPGDADRMFVLEQRTGQIKILKNGQLLPTPFLDVGAISSGGGERGLLGMAFHPDYFVVGSPGEGRFFINYTDNSQDTVVRGYHASANPDVADPSTFEGILHVGQPFPEHNGGCLQFGPEGFLYVGMGDGGFSSNGQNKASQLGKFLRFDIDAPAPYIPPSNPFVGVAGTDDAIWSLGFRNPWRFSFDRQTGDMWIGDVGWGAWEEIDFEPAGTGGLNYGWRCKEGSACTGNCACLPSFVDPVDEYNQSAGDCAVIGGYRYRGSAMPSFAGRYFYGDYCSGNIWSVAFDGTDVSDKVNHKTELNIPGTFYLTSLGEDALGGLYLLDGWDGQIYRLEEYCPGDSTSYCAITPNSAGPGATIQMQGSVSVAANDMELVVNGCPAQVPGLFFYGPSQVTLPLGDGTLCVGSPIYRQSPVVTTSASGVAGKRVDFTTDPEGAGASQILTGSNWFFQYWYRDPAAGGSGFNLSNALDVQFCL